MSKSPRSINVSRKRLKVSANMSKSPKSINVSSKLLKEMAERTECRKLLWEKRFESFLSRQDDDDNISCSTEEMASMDYNEFSKFISPSKNTLKEVKAEKIDAEVQTPEWLSGDHPVTDQDGLDLIIEVITTTMGQSLKCCVLQYAKYYWLKYDGVAEFMYQIMCRLMKQLVREWRLVTKGALRAYIDYIYQPHKQVVKTIECKLRSNIQLLLKKAHQKATIANIQAARLEYTRLEEFLTDEQIMQYCYTNKSLRSVDDTATVLNIL